MEPIYQEWFTNKSEQPDTKIIEATSNQSTLLGGRFSCSSTIKLRMNSKFTDCKRYSVGEIICGMETRIENRHFPSMNGGRKSMTAYKKNLKSVLMLQKT